MQYVVKYKSFFHTFNKEIEDKIKVDNVLSYFNGERKCSVYNEADAVDYVKAIHKLGDIEKLLRYTRNLQLRIWGGRCYFSRDIKMLDWLKYV